MGRDKIMILPLGWEITSKDEKLLHSHRHRMVKPRGSYCIKDPNECPVLSGAVINGFGRYEGFMLRDLNRLS